MMAVESKKDTWQNKLEYFWMYNKLLVIVGVILAVIIGSFVYAGFTEKESALSVMLIDAKASVASETMAEQFESSVNLDTDQYQIIVNAELLFDDAGSGSYAMTSLSKLYADIGTEKLDVCAMKETDFDTYAGADTYMDLSNLINVNAMETAGVQFYEKNGKIYGMYTDSLVQMNEYECYADDAGVIGVVYNTQHEEMAISYLNYLAGI